jgi:lipopolysaccharide/colanic/teichoic acid biosynthesis glycosyltransferase
MFLTIQFGFFQQSGRRHSEPPRAGRSWSWNGVSSQNLREREVTMSMSALSHGAVGQAVRIGRKASARGCWSNGAILVKRMMDVSVTVLALIALAPVFAAVALLVMRDGGPPIFRQRRVGKNGRQFWMYKFRTMIVDAEARRVTMARWNHHGRDGVTFKMRRDPRVTPAGQVLRRTSLDELPQLWNVLKGDMSLVGPRPHPVEDCAQYSSEHCRRLDVKPGVTGLWQVLARANPSFETCMMLDLAYIEKWNLLLDCRILVKTIPAVMAGEGE